MNVVEVKLLRDRSRVCVHWFEVTRDGPAATPLGVVQSPLGPLAVGGVRGRIACRPAVSTVTPQAVNGAVQLLCRSEEPRAVTCPECMATPQFKRAMEEISLLVQ